MCDAFLVLGLPRCAECGDDIEDDACEQDGEFVHPWCACTGCARHRFVDPTPVDDFDAIEMDVA